MILKTIQFLTIFTIIYHHSYAQQNLCTTNAAFTHVPDPSSCHSYLYCRRNGAQVISVHQLSCLGTGAEFYLQNDGSEPAHPIGLGTCVQTNDHCAENLACPPAGTPDIMIADPTDRECRRHRPCRLPGLPWLTCPAPLVFNRNTGSCDFAERAPCTPAGVQPQCPPGGSGNFPGRTCYEFIFCHEGEFFGTFTCGPGLFFDEAQRNCVADTNNVCPRSTIRRLTYEIEEVKSVKGFLRRLGWKRYQLPNFI